MNDEPGIVACTACGHDITLFSHQQHIRVTFPDERGICSYHRECAVGVLEMLQEKHGMPGNMEELFNLAKEHSGEQ